MSRKHFEALAKAISNITNESERSVVTHLIGQVCADQNARFDWARWEDACNRGH